MEQINAGQLLSRLKELSEIAGTENFAVSETKSQTGEFKNVFMELIDKVNESEMAASKTTDAFITGDPDVSLADAMISLQKSNISFQALTEVRNKLVSAYQDVMNMSV